MGVLLSQLMQDRDEGDFAMVGEAQQRNAHVYVKQSFSWDCGVACCSMAQRWANLSDNGSGSSNAGPSTGECPDQSMPVSKATPLWTIDMYCFLREQGLAAAFSTDVAGLNMQHSGLAWYQSHLEDDRVRVEERFQHAADRGWAVDAAVPGAELARLFAQAAEAAEAAEAAAVTAPPSDTAEDTSTANGSGDSETTRALEASTLAAIVLVNNLHLARDFRNGGEAAPPAEAYSGHYVFLLGFSSSCGDALYLDPAKDGALRRCTARLFSAARESVGTDRDLLLLRLSAEEDIPMDISD